TLVAETHLRHHARAEVLEHDVGLLHERGEDLLAARIAQVEADALLAAVVNREVYALAPYHRRMGARLLAARRLDLDDLGAEIGEGHAAAGARLGAGQPQDPHRVERRRRGRRD